jgi:hypothetical protein
MFAVDEPNAEAIRRAWHEGGELSGIVEFQRHFPLINNARARMCVQAILSWNQSRPENRRWDRCADGAPRLAG